jgi:hypothetical protein
MSQELSANAEPAHNEAAPLPVKMAYAFCAAFVMASVLAYIPNPVVGPNAVFVTNTAHNLVHLLTGLAFAGVAWAGAKASIRFMLGFGVAYCLVGVLGFVVLGSAAETHLLGLVHINLADNFLHIGLGLSILAAGLIALTYPKP